MEAGETRSCSLSPVRGCGPCLWGRGGTGRGSEAALGPLAAEAAVEAPDGGAQLAAEVGSLRLGRLLLSCVLVHESLVYLTRSFVYLNSRREFALTAQCPVPWAARHGTGRRNDGQPAEQAAADGVAPTSGGRPVPVGGTDEHDDGRLHVEPGRLYRDHRAAGDLPRHPPGPAGSGEHRLPAVDD